MSASSGRLHHGELARLELAGGGLVIGYAAFTYLIASAPISLVSTFPYVNPVVAVFLGWLVLGEPLSRSVLIGLTVVVGGVVLVVTGEATRSRC